MKIKTPQAVNRFQLEGIVRQWIDRSERLADIVSESADDPLRRDETRECMHKSQAIARCVEQIEGLLYGHE